jgi:hypothetical protein
MLRPGMYPFWFWNGELDEAEIEWQIREMAEKGIRGFFIHPRQGLKQPYLSEAFFRLVEHAVSIAEDAGLVVHLYDEYPYPSGVAGGEVTLGNPQFHATHLVQKTFDSPGGHVRLELPRGKVLNCTAYPLVNDQVRWDEGVDLLRHVGTVLAAESYNEEGLTQYNRKRYFASRPTPVLDVNLSERSARIFASVQVVVRRHKYWWHFVDVLNPDAVRTFLELTHERYYARLGHKFGTSIHSIFVDETEPFWSQRIPSAFKANCGYDLAPVLPALQDDSHPQHLQIKADLAYLRHELFCETFDDAIAQWCSKHNIRYSGEKPSFRLSQLRYMDIPGCEPGHTKAGAPMDLLRARLRQNARGTASAAYFYGKEGALCECFHSLGWSATLQDAKTISEGLLLMGINYLVPHGFFYTTHALAKHDAPPTFFYQMPYWPLFRHLTERIDRIAAHFQGTHIDAQVVIVEPGSGLPSGADLAAYERLMGALMAEKIDFLIVDTDILEEGKIQDGRIRIRDIAARCVIVPPMQMVEQALAGQLKGLREAGVKVLCPSPSFDEGQLAQAILERLDRPLTLDAVDGDLGKLYVVTRTDGRKTLWFLLNTGVDKVTVNIQASAILQEIPLDPSLPAMLLQRDQVYERTIQPFESVLLTTADAPVAVTPPPLMRVPIDNPVRVSPEGKNLLRLYHWDMELLDEQGAPYAAATVPAVPLANQLARGALKFAPTFDTYFGSMPELRLPPLHIVYRARFQSSFDGAVELVMEPGSIVGDWRIRVNESEPLGAAAFQASEAHVRGSIGLDVTRYLRQGQNDITVWVHTDRLDGGLRNPLYLAGDFGVKLNPHHLINRAPVGRFEDYKANGLPFYAGLVEYEAAFTLEKVPEGDSALVQVEHGVPFQEASEVAFNDGEWRPLLWSPYQTLVPTHELRRGGNKLSIRVYTNLIRSFEGQIFDIAQHTYRDIGDG